MIHINSTPFVRSEVAQSCLTLCDPVDCSLPGSSVHGTLQARILQWVAVALLQEIFLTQGFNLHLLHNALNTLKQIEVKVGG